MGRPRKAVASQSLRQMLQEAIGLPETQESLQQMIHDALGSESAKKVECPECGHTFTAKTPDPHKALASMSLLVERIEGLEGETETRVVVMRPGR